VETDDEGLGDTETVCYALSLKQAVDMETSCNLVDFCVRDGFLLCIIFTKRMLGIDDGVNTTVWYAGMC
jgi:hypothetical protein